jgi:hypothetical protein
VVQLRGRIADLKDKVSKPAESEDLSSFRNYGLQYLEKLEEQLNMATSARSLTLRANLRLQVDIGIEWISLQRLRFGSVLQSRNDPQWLPLRLLLGNYSRILGIAPAPLPILGEGYYSTGSFVYYRSRTQSVDSRHYIVSVDRTDKPIFWPLVLHELAHIWLGERDEVDQICGSVTEPDSLSNEERAERVEEALCDVIATRLVGPAYSYSFLHKLWARFDVSTARGYPSNGFRIECMANSLSTQGFSDVASELREMADLKFEERWEREEISWSTASLLSAASEIRGVTPSQTESGQSPSSASPTTLMNDAWAQAELLSIKDWGTGLDRISQGIIQDLERRPVSRDS